MWALHWWEEKLENTEVESPTDYLIYRYLGVDTVLTLPEVAGANEFKRLSRFDVVSLPPSWEWTLRAIREKRLEAIA